MITRLNVASIYVLDKDEALDFYVNKLGLEKGSDVKQGDYRWLTVRVPGNTDVEINLEQPGPPLHDEEPADPTTPANRSAMNVRLEQRRSSASSECAGCRW